LKSFLEGNCYSAVTQLLLALANISLANINYITL
jgi:hypothetical protein